MATPPTAAPPDQPQETALVRHDTDGIDRLKHAPIIDTVDPRTLELIQKQIAPGCSNAEVGHFLELCAHYDLDPFAREAWCAKGKNGGKLLIIVGRDGLRKIAQRNGLHVDGDVVRQNDEFTICRTPDGNRTVTHSYANPAKRGEIVGAWAECRDGGPMGRPMGYFYAPIDEYRPKGASDYSPWSKQVGVMILAAAERQAIRQATPLSGLLAVGEDELVRENERPALGDGQGDGQAAGLDLGPEVEKILARAAALGHAALADRATAEMLLAGQPEEKIRAWVADANRELDAIPQDAEVVEPVLPGNTAQAAEPVREAKDAPQAPAVAPQPPESQERTAALRRRVADLQDDAAQLEADGDPRAEEVREEADLIAATIEAETDLSQSSLPL